MHAVSSAILLAVFWDAQLTRWIVWVGLVVLTIALLLLIRTRWGQSQPLGKCVVLSLLAHLLLGIYTTTVNIVTATVGSPDGEGIQVALVSGAAGDAPDADPSVRQPFNDNERFDFNEGFRQHDLAPRAEWRDAAPAAEPERQAPSEPTPTPVTNKPLEAPAVEDAAPPTFTSVKEPINRPAPVDPEPIELPRSDAGDNLDLVPAPEEPTETPGSDTKKPSDDAGPDAGGARAGTGDSEKPPGTPASQSPSGDDAGSGARLGIGPPGESGPAKPLPGVLKQRVGDHVGKGHGATPQTEAAVTAALAWLAANQRSSGRWDARGLGGGAGRAADGEERQAAGMQADAGISGLALLAFLAAGHTHLQGPHQNTVRRGLEFLLNVQDADGCLAGTANKYERMYCHAMATCAVSEAFAMTGDERIQPTVRRAIQYTLRAQDRVTGGWRYQPSDPGDTSQLGWQLMALKSAELAGIPIPQQTRDGIGRFLRSVSLGRNGGLACYQPARPMASRSMTAEALACRQFMGLIDREETTAEASGYLLQEMPGAGTTNHYYWYYATLALYQTQGEAWRRWNEALQKNLLASQRQDAHLAGSWDPDPVWGGCGGRAYSTALATLCLEVYYRFLPLYVEAAGRERRAK